MLTKGRDGERRVATGFTESELRLSSSAHTRDFKVAGDRKPLRSPLTDSIAMFIRESQNIHRDLF